MEKVKYRRGKKGFFQKKRRKGPPVRFLLFIIIILALLYLIVGFFGGGKAKELKDYVTATNNVVNRSNKIAQEFNDTIENPSEYTRANLKTKLASFEKESKGLVEDGEKIDVPGNLKEANDYFIICLKLRAEGLKNYQPALFNALKDKDLEVASTQISSTLKYLALSDRAYEIFSSQTGKELKKEGAEISVSDSQFLKNPNLYEKAVVVAHLKQLQGVKSLKEVHGIEVVEFSTQPKRKSFLSAKNLAVLPKTSQLTVTVVVKNQGNQTELSIPVVVTLKSTAETKEQSQEGTITSISPGQKKSVTIKGLKPNTSKNVTNLLTITAGPVPKEKETRNNVKEFKFTTL